jgi:hypothetical protein
MCAVSNEGEGESGVGSASSSLLRPLAPLMWPALLVGCLLWITPPAAAAGSPAPDPAPAVQPDAYAAPTPAGTPRVVTPVPKGVAVPPAPAPAFTAAKASHTAVSGSRRPHRSQQRPSSPIRFPLPTLFAGWLRYSAAQPASARPAIPAEVGLAIAALVLLSAGFVAAAAREVRR